MNDSGEIANCCFHDLIGKYYCINGTQNIIID